MKEKVKENKYYQIGLTLFLVVIASITFYLVITNIGLLYTYLKIIISFFTPFIIGFVFAFLLNPIVKFFNEKLFKKVCKIKKEKVSNTLSITLTFALFVGLILLLISYILPELLKSVETLAVNLPTYFNDTKNYLLEKLSDHDEIKTIILNNYEAINDYLTNFTNNTLMPQVEKWLVSLSNGVFGAVKVVFNIAMGFVISIYYLSDKEGFISGIKKITYSIFKVKTANHILDNARHTNDIFGNFCIGKLLDGFTVGFITFIFLTIFGYPYALLIGVLIGITNMIPYFGPYIGTIPSALLILMDNPTKCLVFILFIIALQQVDSYIIEPRLCGSRTGLKSFWVLASILLFGNIFGIVGMLVAVPVFALIYGYLNNKVTTRLKEKKLPTEAKDYSNLERINSETNKPIKM